MADVSALSIRVSVRVVGKLYRPAPWRAGGFDLSDCVGVRVALAFPPGKEWFKTLYFDTPEPWQS